jgi:hypothetical protein
MMRSKEIKPQGDTRFKVENPPNMRGTNHGRQLAIISFWLEALAFGFTRASTSLRQKFAFILCT